MASTEGTADVSPVVTAAARGELPEWAVAGEPRRRHMRRVSDLLSGWAADLGLPRADVVRWAAAGWLHDALRDAAPDDLWPQVPESLRDLPAPLLHGPAAAERLGDDIDTALADAIRYHTIGHPRLDLLGRALYLADFLEPGRDFAPAWRAALRSGMPHEIDDVLPEVVAARIKHLLDERVPLRPETAEFWSALALERR